MLRIKGFKLALAVFALSITGCPGDKSSLEYFEQGKSHQRNGDFKAAIIEYKNSIRLDPANSQGRLVLGKLYLESDQYAAAKKELVRAGRDDELQQQALIPLAMATLKLNLHQELLALPLLTSGLSRQDLVIAYVLRGQSLMAQGEREQALAEYSMANDINEQAVYARLGQVMTASARADLAGAIVLAKSLLEDQPEMEEAMLLYGSLSHSHGDFDNAIAVYDKYIALNNDRISQVNLLLADSLISNNNMARAKEELDRLLTINYRHPGVNAMLARMAYQEGDFEQALSHASTALELIPTNVKANLMAAMSSFRLAKFEDSYHYFARIEKYLAGMIGPQIMQIINRIKRGDIEDARKSLKSLAPIDKKYVTLYMLAAHQFTVAQDYQTGLRLLEQARPFLPDDNELTLKIGLLKVELGDPMGLDDLSSALVDPNLIDDVVPHVVKAFARAKRFDDLQSIANELKVKFSEKSHGWDIAAIIALYQKDYPTAEQLYRINLAKFPDNILALRNLANLRFQQGDNSGSLAYINQVLALQPSHFGATQFKARLIFRQTKDIEQYKKVFKDAFKLFPDSEMLIVEMAGIYAAQGEIKQALDLLGSIIDRETLSEHYWSRYGRLLAAARQPAKALAIYQQWAQRQPGSPVPLFKQIGMSERLGRYKDGLRLVEQAARKFGQLKNLEGLKISLMMLDGQLGSARLLFNTYRHNNANAAYLSGIEGELLFREKNYHLAKSHLNDVYSSSKKPRYVMLLAQTHIALGKFEPALTVLKEHLELEPLNRPVKALLANTYAKLKSPLAVNLYDELVTAAPNNPLYLNNLAWTLSDNGQYQQALIHIEKAIKLMPEHPQILDSYGLILLKLNQHQQAKVQFEKAIDLAPKKIEFVLHNAELLIAMDKKQQAKRLLERIGAEVPASLKQQFELLMRQTETS